MLPEQPSLPRAYGFDDVIVMPGGACVPSHQVSLDTAFTTDHPLKLPLIAKVAKPKDAIMMAQQGSVGILDSSLSFGAQVEAVRQVKRHQARLLRQPHTVTPDTSVAEAQDMQLRFHFSALPVVDPTNRQVVGIVTRNDVAKGIDNDPASPVSDVMSTDLLSVTEHASDDEVQKILQEQMVGQVIVLNDKGHLVGLRTASDFAKRASHPFATVDLHGRLLVGAVVGTGVEEQDRLTSLLDMGVDVILLEQTFAHTQAVQDMVTYIRRQRCEQKVTIIAGAAHTSDGARALLGSGADMLWVNIHDTQHADTGVGVPGLTALQNVIDAAALTRNSVWITGVLDPILTLKALALGAAGVMAAAPDAQAIASWSKILATGVGQTGSKDLKNIHSYARLAIVT